MPDVPKRLSKVQQRAVQATSPVSESLLDQLAGNLNALIDAIEPPGTYCYSDLTLTQFQAIKGLGWVLADGQDCTGSRYAIIKGVTTVPDHRGLVPRVKDNGRGINTSGNLPLGSYQPDQVGPHTHIHDVNANDYSGFYDINPPPPGGLLSITPYISDQFDSNGGANKYRFKPSGSAVVSNGTPENNVRSLTVNAFIRIN